MRSSFTLTFFYKSIITSALLFYFINNVNAQISGTVFRDFNGDGVKAVTSSSSLEPGVKGITVTAYPATGVLQTTTTDNSGNYSFSGLTLPARIEFTNLPNGTFASSFGSGSGTSVQFYSATTSNANFGINNPAHYSQANPDIITPKHLTGDPLASGSNMSSESALYKFPNTASGDAQSGGTPVTTLATQAQIGSTWGVAYERVSKKFFMSSVYRRHAPLGPGETGGRIYVIDNANSNTSGTPTKFIDLVSDLGISVGTIETNAARGLPDNKFIASEDNNTFSAAGKVGLGDIDISDDGQFLFVVNLFDKKVYKIDIAQTIAGTPNAVALPNFTLSCSNGSSRPWGLGMWDGELYLGVVCDAASGVNADLRMTVQKFNFTTNSWTEVFNVTPDWDKGDVIFGSAKFKWQKWEDVWNNFSASNWPVHPQPLIGDIEFDEEGSMHLAVLDRTGFQAGHRQKRVPDDGNLYSGITGGELLRTYKDPSTGAFNLENNGSCGPYVTGGTGNNSQTGQGGSNTSQGPGGGEFYCDDYTGNAHSETTSGGLSLLKGSRKIASIQMDPIDGQLDAQGVTWFNTTDGLELQEYQIFQNNGTPSPDFSKQNGLGDLEFLSDPAPIEIGNRVFMDTDSDGEQDADEMGLDGVKVELWKSGAKVTETTTANGGQWYFSNIDFNTDYEVKILAASFPSGKSLTTSNVASNAKDLIDNDAALVGSDAVIAYKTGSAGQNNHSLDFGFKVACNLTAAAAATNVTCNAGTDGTATATPTGNLSAVTYAWSNGATTASVTNLAAGVYNVTVTETPSCTATASVTITEPTDLTLACTKTDATTIGGNEGTATVAASGGTAPYAYLWSNGTTTANITGLTAGTYTVTVSDTNGCSDVCSSQVNEPSCNLTASATAINVKCNLGTDGSATVTATGNTVAVTYLWSNGGATTATISSLSAGVYTVTVTETPSCTATASVTVTEPADLTLACTKTDVTTTGGNNGTATVTALGGTAPYAYLWSNGATTNTITSLTAGTYTVTVSDTNGCSDVCNSQINEPGCNLTASATGTNVTCNAGTNGTASATATGNTGAVTYLWSNGATTNAITGLTAGTYTITVTESANCTATASYTVTEPADLTLNCTKTDVTTTGGNDGTATVSASGGTTPYAYLWSNGTTTASITGLTAGTYTVTVTDANGCSDVCNSQINEPSCNLTASATGTNVTCNAGTDGTANATPTGNLSPVTYVWSNGATTVSVANLAAGVYNVTVTESANCTATASYNVTQPSDITLNCTKTDVTTTGGNNGTATVAASGGTAPYVYLWSNGATTATVSSLTAGAYSVTVTDANGCSDVCNSQINEPGCNLTASATGTNVTCNAGTNGTATATATGNTGAITYIWSNGATTNTITGLTAGTYTVTVTETANCKATANYIVTEPSDLTVVCAKTDVTTTGGSDGTAQVTASGGTTVYAYLWSNGATTNAITGLTAGTYNVTVTDANGCSDACSVTLLEPIITACTKPNAGADEVLVCTNQVTPTTAILVAAPAGTTWSVLLQPANVAALISQTGNVTNMLATGRYLFLLTNNSDNTCKDTVEIRIKNCPELPLCGTDKYELNADAGLTMYQWFKKDIAGTTFDPIVGETNATITVTTVGSYTWTAKDANGCVISACDTVKFSCLCALTVTTTSTNVTCNAKNDGTAQATVTGNVGAVTYLWSNGQTTAAATGLIAGTHSVTVTENANCIAVASVTITEPAALVLTCTKVNVTTNNGTDGQASVTAAGGTTPYTYLWSNGATTSSITGLTAGTYTVTLTDAKGCSDNCTSIITEPGCALTVTTTATNVTCYQKNDGTAQTTVTGNLSAVTYLWDSGETTAALTGLKAGIHTVTVSEIATCKAISSVTITEPAALVLTCDKVNVTTNNGNDGQASVTAVGGTSPYTYVWSNGATTASITGLTAGTYTVTVTDAQGCSEVCFSTLTQPSPLGSLGDFIWKDLNNDGLQNNGELGVAGVIVELYDNTNPTVILKSDTTDNAGNYLFTNLTSGDYFVKFSVPANMPTMEISSKQNQGGDDTIDNDFDTNGKSDVVTIDVNDPLKKDIITVDGAIINKPNPLGSLGDLIWKDLNNNGLQDNGEAGVSGVIVELYNADANGKPTSAVLATDTTDTNGNYLFTNLNNGVYVVKIITSSIMNTMEISIKQNVGPDDEVDNDFDKTSGLSTKVTIDVNDPLKKDIVSVDGAIVNKPVELGSLGDFIWKDLNDNGLQDNGETGVAGVVLTLFFADPWGKPIGNALKADTTDANGKYLFTNLESGRYVVVLDPTSIMSTMELSKKQDSGADDAVDNDFNSITFYAGSVIVDPTDPAKKDVLTVDGAIINKPLGSIGDFVWKDLNDNGLQDNGEIGVSGVIITLFNSDASGAIVGAALASDTTDTNGAYLFSNLPKGDYVLQMVPASIMPSMELSPKVGIGNDTLNNDFSPVTWLTPKVSIDPTDPDKKDITTVDGAIINKPLGSIGDFVWKDLNDNGLQDNGEVGVSGIIITLFKSDASGAIVGAALASDTTDTNGAYLFPNLPKGDYVLQMVPASIMPTMELSPKVGIGNDTLNNDFSPITWLTPKISIDPYDPAKKDIITVDGAIINKVVVLGSIGDYVWMDMDNDGTQDNGEAAVSGVILELYLASNLTTPIKKDTTDSNGNYLFTNLGAGDYVVKAVSSSFPAGKIVGKKDATTDDKDSDFDAITFQSPTITLNPGNTGGDPLKKDNLTIDLGLYLPINCPAKICTPVKVTKVK